MITYYIWKPDHFSLNCFARSKFCQIFYWMWRFYPLHKQTVTSSWSRTIPFTFFLLQIHWSHSSFIHFSIHPFIANVYHYIHHNYFRLRQRLQHPYLNVTRLQWFLMVKEMLAPARLLVKYWILLPDYLKLLKVLLVLTSARY